MLTAENEGVGEDVSKVNGKVDYDPKSTGTMMLEGNSAMILPKK